MLVICEDCAKKYNIDETRIKGDRARFSCRECGHIIVVERPVAAEQPADPTQTDAIEPDPVASTDSPTTEDQDEQEKKTRSNTEEKERGASHKPGRGMPITAYLVLALMVGFLSIGAAFTYLYFRYIPQLMNTQVDMRTRAIATMFAGVVQQPLLVNNYLKVNQEAERISRLPGVAYAAVENRRGIVVAGFFQELDHFDAEFADLVKTRGFPSSILKNNPAKGGQHVSRFLVGGQMVQDMVVPLPQSKGAIHVGVHLSDIQRQIDDALLSPLSLGLMGGLFFGGLLIFIYIARSISRPLIQLTDVVNRISLGEMDLTMEPRGPREIRELTAAFERMRFSIKAALKRLGSR